MYIIEDHYSIGQEAYMMKHWDHIIVYLIVNRLDHDTHESWELKQGASVSPSSLKDLLDFVEGRARALENIEGRSIQKSASSLSPTQQFAQVNVIGPMGNTVTARALIDQGSELSFITERIVQALELKRSPASVPLVGIALRTMEQLVIDHGSQFPLGASVLSKGRYVDDIFAGADTIEECQEVVKQVNNLCMAGCFPLQKWISNDPSTLASISTECHIKETSVKIKESLKELEPSAQWRFVPGKDNPADCASRGLCPKALKTHTLWWSGPSWLAEDSTKWPTTSHEPAKEAVSELKRQKSSNVVCSYSEPELLSRYSDLNKLLCITSWCKRFINRLKGNHDTAYTPYLTPKELNDSLLFWTGFVQNQAFIEEFKLLKMNKPVHQSSKLYNFNPFFDHDKLIRVGGRLQNASIEYDTKHPFILPKDSLLSKLIINDAHIRTLHSGTTNTLSKVRQRFWILGGRPTVKKELSRCVICARYRSEQAQQLMGQLPPSRVTPSRPFLHSGVDYAGPFIIKTWHGRAAKTYKGYIVLFICSSSSAIHLELVTDYSSEAFIAAYKRFTARRGICATITSDCGTTFVGSDSELNRLFTASTSESNKLRDLLSKDGTLWKFNPPSAPHFGGHWEAGVKSVKYHLKRVVGDHILTYEEFLTVLIEIEGVLNSRPLCKLTEDPDDLTTLTPAHFLVGGALSAVPEPDLKGVPQNRLSRWQLLQQMKQSFWKRWSKEYLQKMQTMYKWRSPSTPVEIGSIVLIIDEQYPPSKWPLARVIGVHPGQEKITRVVTLQTATGILKRPIVKFCRLPISSAS
ncbi:uncharacterized protein LOC128997139 [Macrosteles quadrilineatus]|uniref:uncharacterized protein LOC128997139 n=1 Tax=Macrosteles quadrilineatus TaxID=74068 RepID=UPI0023E1E466|nr:uncharacterized protein LOC128997139 [Macrosteles quadrilineatus]